MPVKHSRFLSFISVTTWQGEWPILLGIAADLQCRPPKPTLQIMGTLNRAAEPAQ